MDQVPVEMRAPGLVFTHDGMKGYGRRRHGKGFAFYLPCGTLLTDGEERKRLLALGVPPAYRNVWICMLRNGHLQATGLDVRGRKQYRYHPEWIEWAGSQKFGQLLDFARALPRIRLNVAKLLADHEICRERIIAGVVRLLDRTGYRIGNARYEKENGSYGLTSILPEHVEQVDDGFRLTFRGKSGMLHETDVTDRRLVQLIEELHDLPGQHLFKYENAEGNWHDLDSVDINSWLKEVGGGDFTAKQFRTWRATVLCARSLGAAPPAESRAARMRIRNYAIKHTAALLHHRPATCRKYYVHPAVFAGYATGDLYRLMRSRPPALRRSDGSCGLRADERRVFRLIERYARTADSASSTDHRRAVAGPG
jgi:DNA topoisomerase-1